MEHSKFGWGDGGQLPTHALIGLKLILDQTK